MLVAKLGIPVLFVGVGGGVTLGVSKQSSNPVETVSVSSNSVSSSPEVVVSAQRTEEVSTAMDTQKVSQEEQSDTAKSQSDQEIPMASPQSEPESPVVVKGTGGNCEVITSLQEVIDALSLDSSYVAFTCENKGINEDEDDGLEEKWTGLFPREFFVEGGSQLTGGYKLNIETDTKDQETEELYKTVFQSDSFSSNKEITGRWDSGEKYYDGKLVDFVKVTSQETDKKIYFVHTGEDE